MTNPNLSNIEIEVLQAMNRGYYLILIGSSEGVGMYDTITTGTKKGTIKVLLNAGYVREVEGFKERYKGKCNKFLLTDKGRDYRVIEK